MAQNQLETRDKLEKYYSSLIKVLKDEKSNYEEEKKKYTKSIEKYREKIKENLQIIIDINKDTNNFINITNLTPEKFYELKVLERKNRLYETIIEKLVEKKEQNWKILDEHIEACQNQIDKLNNELELIKKAIWNEGMLKIKLNEAIDLEELKEYYNRNVIIVSKFNN